MKQEYSKSFVPYIPRDRFDDVAQEFLSKYCPEALRKPMPVPIWDIAVKKIQLEIYDSECLSHKNDILGAITLCDGIIDVYDINSRSYKGIEVLKGMVFIDKSIINEGRKNNTVAHECVHWFKHRPYFIRRSASPDFKAIAFRCPIHEIEKSDDEVWEDAEIMEWQARNIAPRILMPKKMFNIKIDEYLTKYSNNQNRYDALRETINALAEFFAVSRQSAAIRMLDLGFEEAREYCYFDYDTKHSKVDKKKPRNELFSSRDSRLSKIGIQDAYKEYQRNRNFREVIDTGAFKYVEGYYVLNEEKYVQTNSIGKDVLTEYANNHLSDCVLDFRLTLERKVPRYYKDDNDIFYMYKVGEYTQKTSFSTTPHNASMHDRGLFLKVAQTEMLSQKEERLQLPNTFHEMFLFFLNNRNWDTKKFKDKTLLTDNELSRMKKIPPQTSKRTIMAVCIGMKLPFDLATKFLAAAGFVLVDSDDLDNAYKYILNSNIGDIDLANDLLLSAGLEPLGSRQKL